MVAGTQDALNFKKRQVVHTMKASEFSLKKNRVCESELLNP